MPRLPVTVCTVPFVRSYTTSFVCEGTLVPRNSRPSLSNVPAFACTLTSYSPVAMEKLRLTDGYVVAFIVSVSASVRPLGDTSAFALTVILNFDQYALSNSSLRNGKLVAAPSTMAPSSREPEICAPVPSVTTDPVTVLPFSRWKSLTPATPDPWMSDCVTYSEGF